MNATGMPSGVLPTAMARAAVDQAASELATAGAEAVRSLAGDLVESIAALTALDAPPAGAPPDRAQRLMAFLALRLPTQPPSVGETVESVVRRSIKDTIGPAIEQVLSASVASALGQLQTKLAASLRAADPALLSTMWLGGQQAGGAMGKQQQQAGQAQGQQQGQGGGQARWEVPSAVPQQPWGMQPPPLSAAFGAVAQAGMGGGMSAADQLAMAGGLLAGGQYGQLSGSAQQALHAAAATNALLLSQAGLGGQLSGGMLAQQQAYNASGGMFGQQQQQSLQQFMQQGVPGGLPTMAALQLQQHAPGSLGSMASAYLPAGAAAGLGAAGFGGALSGGGASAAAASGGSSSRGHRRRSRSRSRERGGPGGGAGGGTSTRPAGRAADVIDVWRSDPEWTWAGAVLRYVEKHDLPPPGGAGSPSDRDARDAWALLALARLIVFAGMYEHSRKVARSAGRTPYLPPRVPPRPATLDEARHLVTTLLASDHILAFVLWLSCLADMEASHRLALEERGVPERAMDAETRHHRESVRVEGLHTLRRRTQYESFIVSTRLTEKMYEQEGIIVMKGMYLACEGMQLGVDGKATTVKIPGAVATSWIHKAQETANQRGLGPEVPPTKSATDELAGYVTGVVSRSL